MSATEGSEDGRASTEVAQTVRSGPLVAVEPRDEAFPSDVGAAPRELGRLAEVVLPADATAPGAARIVIGHCLTGLVARRIVGEAQLLGGKLVESSLLHARLDRGDTVLVRVYLGAEALRIEIENEGTVGVAATRPPDDRSVGGFGLQLLELLAERWGVARTSATSVWFEMRRA